MGQHALAVGNAFHDMIVGRSLSVIAKQSWRPLPSERRERLDLRQHFICGKDVGSAMMYRLQVVVYKDAKFQSQDSDSTICPSNVFLAGLRGPYTYIYIYIYTYVHIYLSIYLAASWLASSLPMGIYSLI